MKRILLIEDDESIAAIERDYLVRSGFAVDIAATGDEGLALGRTGKYDLILLDLMLPGLDGFSACHAQIKANLAQYDRLKGGGAGRAQIQMGDIRIQEDSRRVFAEEREVTLKNKEYELLLFLMSNPDIVFSKEALYERIWGCDALGDNATVAVHINRLREKTEKTPSEPRHIQTVWGAGYRFRP